MKTIIVYYSLEGNTDTVANLIQKETNADMLRLVPQKEIPKTGISKYIWGGKQATFSEKPELKAYTFHPEEYDRIIIGTPIWAGNYAPSIRTFLADHKFIEKDIYLFACHLGGGADKCFTKMREKLVGNRIKETVDFVDVEKNKSEIAWKIKNMKW